MMATRGVSRKGVEFIASFEGFVDHAYRGPGEQYLTIGYGHYGPDVKPGQTITKRAALKLLKKDVRASAEAVKKATRRSPHKLRQQDLDALTSFTFNNGVGSLESSTLLKRWNAGDNRCLIARQELPKWVHDSTGEVSPGLVKRRNAEAHLICTGHYH